MEVDTGAISPTQKCDDRLVAECQLFDYQKHTKTGQTAGNIVLSLTRLRFDPLRPTLIGHVSIAGRKRIDAPPYPEAISRSTG